MLSEIMNSFKTGEPQNLEELSQRLGTERSALEGMLMTLVRQGKLKEVILGAEDCNHCSIRASCNHFQKGETLGKVYELVEESRYKEVSDVED
jgi:hypothetical protein